MSSAGPSPEELVTELAHSAELAAAWIPARVRGLQPRLLETASKLMSVTLQASGREDLACLVASEPRGDSLAAIEAELARYGSTPFLLLLPPPGEPAGAVRISTALIQRCPQLRARDLGRDHGPVLVAPLQRLLDTDALAGEWSGAPLPASDSTHAESALVSLWSTAADDRQSLDALAARLESESQQRRDTQRALVRATAEIARLRLAEQHEVARLELMLTQERAWVAAQTRRIAASRSWRIGHGFTRLGRRLVLRSDRGTNLPAMIAQRMDEADLR